MHVMVGQLIVIGSQNLAADYGDELLDSVLFLGQQVPQKFACIVAVTVYTFLGAYFFFS